MLYSRYDVVRKIDHIYLVSEDLYLTERQPPLIRTTKIEEGVLFIELQNKSPYRVYVFDFSILKGNISAFSFNKRAKKSLFKLWRFGKKEVLMYYKYFRAWLNGDFNNII